MYYSESLNSPIAARNVKSYYGIDPDTNPETARAIGIYPLTEAPEGYSAIAFVKEGNAYRAIPHEFSNEERDFIARIKLIGNSIREFVSDCIPSWDAATTFYTGTYVDHNGNLWQAASASTGVEPVITYDEAGLPIDSPDWTFII